MRVCVCVCACVCVCVCVCQVRRACYEALDDDDEEGDASVEA